MTRYGMLIDTTKCTGCMSCAAACQSKNGLEPTEMFVRFESQEQGLFPNVRTSTVPLQCMHCEDAPCAAVCPTHATHITDSGIVAVDHGRCIGCKYCMAACPYQVRVEVPSTGAVDKCRFCTASVDEGSSEDTCVTACPNGVRVFGDLDDPNSDISKALAQTNAVALRGNLTKAKVFYVR